MEKNFTRYAVPPKSYTGDNKNRKCIVLDLDSTLVYTFGSRPPSFNQEDGKWLCHSVEEVDGTVSTYYVLIRPFAREFLRQCAQYYDIVFFTAASRDYAEPIFDKLCPEVRHRYYREDCVMDGPFFMKDLSCLSGLEFDRRRVFLFDDNAPDNTLPPTNGMFCSQFCPNDEDDNSSQTVTLMQLDHSLQAFAQLFSTSTFREAEDIREPIAQYTNLMAQRLHALGETDEQ